MSATPRPVPLAQGMFYVATGLWPIVHLGSFEAVTGPKVDRWLVRTVGGLIAAIGASLIAGAFERRTSRAIRMLGMGSAAALGLADVIHVGRGRIPKIYLGDAVVEAALIAGWVID
jgi:energy-converting hydrogenase Eha subunit E